MGCVYLATNQVNGKCYVGQAVNLEKRKEKHAKDATRGSMLAFHCAIRKYGFDAFDWKKLYQVCTKDVICGKEKMQLDRWERYYIKKLNTISPNGYNLTKGGDRFSGRHRLESRQKIRVASIAHWLDPEYRKKCSKAVRISLSKPEVRNRIRKSVKKSWSDPEIYAKHKSGSKNYWDRPESRKKNSSIQKVAQNKPGVRNKKSASMKKTCANPEVKLRKSRASTEVNSRPGMREKKREIGRRVNGTLDARKRSSEASIKAHADPEVIKKIRSGLIKSWARYTPEERIARIKTITGKRRTNKTKIKMSASQKIRRDRERQTRRIK